MQTYTPPLRDMRFVLHELHDAKSLMALPGLADMTPDVLDAVLDEAGKFISATLLPLNAGGDAEGCRYEDGEVHTPKGFKAAYRAFVAENGVHLVIVYQEWFPGEIPEDWQRVGTLSLSRTPISAAYRDAQFYVTDSATASQVRNELASFQKTLPPGVKLTIF